MKAATTYAPTSSAKPDAKALIPEGLTVSGAATICERILTGLKAKHELATEVSEKSTDTEIVVTWPPNEGKPPVTCTVSKATQKLLSLSINDKTLSEPQIAEMDRDAGFREDFKLGKYENFVRFAKDDLAKTFKDPGAVQFRGLFISGRAMPVLCGEVNGKNSYGAYGGFRRFYATGKPMLNEVEPTRDTFVFTRMWPSMCGEKTTDITE